MRKRTKLGPAAKAFFWFGVFLLAALIVAVCIDARGAEVPPEPIKVAAVDAFNVSRDTPFGEIAPGGDITEALQWSLDRVHEIKRRLEIPAGRWKLSGTIETPFRSGLQLHGAGRISPYTNTTMTGAGTVLEWHGERGGTMLEYTGVDSYLGDFTLDGRGVAEIGLLINKPRRGLGVGKLNVDPLIVYRLRYGVQMGKERLTDNCDNVRFRWLEGEKCEAVYYGVNLQGMDNIIEHLRNYGGNTYGVLMDGGGQLWVQSSLTTHASTLLEIRDGAGFGPNNAFFRFSHTKVDNQAANGFTLVDSASPSEIRMLFDGGIHANTKFAGKFANLTGSNSLHITDFSSTFYEISGKRHNAWGSPTVLLESCRIWGWNDGSERPVSDLFTGELSARVRNCTRTDGRWLDYSSEPTPLELELQKLNRRIDGITLRIPSDAN